MSFSAIMLASVNCILQVAHLKLELNNLTAVLFCQSCDQARHLQSYFKCTLCNIGVGTPLNGLAPPLQLIGKSCSCRVLVPALM